MSLICKSKVKIKVILALLITCATTLLACEVNHVLDIGTSSSASPSASVTVDYSEIGLTPSVQSTETTLPFPVIDGAKLRESWLNGESCTSPCWNGITPGLTSANDAYSLISANELFVNVVRETAPLTISTTGSIAFEYYFKDDYGEVILCYVDLFFNNATPEQAIRAIRSCIPPTMLSEFIEKWGEPSHVNTYFDYQHTPSSWGVFVIWMDQGIEIGRRGIVPVYGVVDALEFDNIILFRPGLEGYLEAVGSNQLEGLREWQGYADFEFYHRYSCCTPVSPSP